jgi:hypothetical protein
LADGMGMVLNISFTPKKVFNNIWQQTFLCSDPDDIKTPLLAERARYLKTDPEGVELMCKAMEELRQESFQRGIALACSSSHNACTWYLRRVWYHRTPGSFFDPVNNAG